LLLLPQTWATRPTTGNKCFIIHLDAETSEPLPGLVMLFVMLPCPKLGEPWASIVHD